MFGFDDAAGMGLGMINAGINAAMAGGMKKKQKKLMDLEKQGQRDEYAYQQEELANQGRELQHAGEMGEAGVEGSANDRGVYKSSIPTGEKTELNYQKDTRMNALKRRKMFNEKNMARQEEAWNVQRQLQGAQQRMQLINSLMQGGGGGALGMLGGGGGK